MLSYFSQSKGGDTKSDTKSLNVGSTEPKLDVAAPARKADPSQEIVSTLGPGLLITGNVVSTGTVQIHGRVIGDIHAARLLVSKGAVVEARSPRRKRSSTATSRAPFTATTSSCRPPPSSMARFSSSRWSSNRTRSSRRVAPARNAGRSADQRSGQRPAPRPGPRAGFGPAGAGCDWPSALTAAPRMMACLPGARTKFIDSRSEKGRGLRSAPCFFTTQ